MADPRFPPVQNRPQAPPSQRPGGGGFPVVPIILLAVYGLYVAVMLVAPIYSEGLADTLDGFLTTDVRLAIGGVLLVVFIIIMVFNLMDTGKAARSPGVPRPGPISRPPVTGQPTKFKPVSPAASAMMTAPPSARPQQTPPPSRQEPIAQSPQPIKRTVVPYPLEVEGGIYGETMIPLSASKVLKLRSLVVEPEYLD